MEATRFRAIVVTTSSAGGSFKGTAVKGFEVSLSTLSGKVNTLTATVTSIRDTVGTIDTNTSNLSTLGTVLYIAVILAAVVAVLEIVIPIRKK